MCVIMRMLNSLGKNLICSGLRDLPSSKQLIDLLQPLNPLHQYNYIKSQCKDADFTAGICLDSVELELGIVSDE